MHTNLIQLMTCRNLSKALPNKCYYVPLVDKDGYIINDPLIIRSDDQKWRICIADSDVILFAKGILSTKNLSAEILRRTYPRWLYKDQNL